MPKLWLVFGLSYVVISTVIFLDQFLRYEAMWNWDEALHHECFIIATIWVASAYLFVALVERVRGKR